MYDRPIYFAPPTVFALLCTQGVGEPPLLLATTVFFAIKDAIGAARKDAGLIGLFQLDSPATTERIRMACTDQFTRQVRDPCVERHALNE